MLWGVGLSWTWTGQATYIRAFVTSNDQAECGRTRTRRGRRMVKRRDGARGNGITNHLLSPGHATPFLFFSRCPSSGGRRRWTTLQTPNPLFALGVSSNSLLILCLYRHSPCVTNNSIICENYISSPPCLCLCSGPRSCPRAATATASYRGMIFITHYRRSIPSNSQLEI